MPKVLEEVQTGKEPVKDEKLTMPVHCGHRLLTGAELIASECTAESVPNNTYVGKMLPSKYLWYLVKCAKPGRNYFSLSTINLVREDEDGGLRLVLAGTTLNRITNYIENQPKWALCPSPSVCY
jgi:hypothetical protein